MSAAVCGKRSLFEEAYGSPPLSKRVRCGGGSPIRFPSPAPPLRIVPGNSPGVGSSTSSTQGKIDVFVILQQIFPGMDESLFQKALDSCGNNIDSAIRSLNELRLGSGSALPLGEAAASIENGREVAGEKDQAAPAIASSEPHAVKAEEESASQQPPPDSATLDPSTMDARGWVELVVREMMSSVNLEDARGKAARVLEAFEQAVLSRGSETAALVEVLQKEKVVLKEHLAKLNQDNSILKRAVAIHHSRQQEHEERGREVQQLKQVLAQYQEQLRSLEMANYALNVHLKTAQQSNSMPNRFHPDVF